MLKGRTCVCGLVIDGYPFQLCGYGDVCCQIYIRPYLFSVSDVHQSAHYSVSNNGWVSVSWHSRACTLRDWLLFVVANKSHRWRSSPLPWYNCYQGNDLRCFIKP